MRTFVYDPSNPNEYPNRPSGVAGQWVLPLAQIRGLTQAQYLNFWALPNTAGVPRNNELVLVTITAGTQMYSGLTGPITGPTGLFWGTGGGTQYNVGTPSSNRLLPPQLGVGIGRTGLGHIYARYDGDFRQDFTAHTVTAGAAFRF